MQLKIAVQSKRTAVQSRKAVQKCGSDFWGLLQRPGEFGLFSFIGLTSFGGKSRALASEALTPESCGE